MTFRSLALSASFILLAFPSARATESRPGDWRFTRADYAQLLKRGGHLQFADDSSWMTLALKTNLMTAIDHALTNKPESSLEISIHDFYHGHYSCHTPADRTNPAGKRFNDIQQKPFVSRGLQWSDRFTSANFKVYSESLAEAVAATGAELRAMTSACEKPVVIYHTLEWVRPEGVADNSPRRNLRVALGSNEITHFEPEVVDVAHLKIPQIYIPGFTMPAVAPEDYGQAFQFAFLIDRNGFIHATINSFNELSVFFGHNSCEGDRKPPCK